MSNAMAEVFRARGWDATQAAIDLTDARYADRFSRFPMGHAFLDVVRMLPAQLRRRTGEIRIPAEAQAGDYDLVCVFSPTWWLTTSIPVRSFLKADTTAGLLAGKPFTDVVVCRRYWANNHRTVRDLGSGHGERTASATSACGSRERTSPRRSCRRAGRSRRSLPSDSRDGATAARSCGHAPPPRCAS
jgi:hypothetical protein